MSGDSDDLTEFVTARDEQAFQRLFERYWGLVWTTCHRSGAESPDDAAQAVFLVLATRAKRLINTDESEP